jgi:hypothetical protein
MKGWIYRLAVSMKDVGETWGIYPLIWPGLAIRGRV